MGRTLLIVLLGFATSFGILAQSKNRRMLESVDRMVESYATYTIKNTSNSGAYLALNKLYLNPSWNAGFDNIFIGGDSLVVGVTSGGANLVYVTSKAYNDDSTDSVRVTLFNAKFSDFAVWSKDSLLSNLTVKDSLNNNDTSLLKAPAPFMPDIDSDSLVALATIQSHYYNGDLTATDEYPNNDFEYAGSTPNVTVVKGNLEVAFGAEVFGIFIVDGDVTLHSDSFVRGVIYLPNASSTITNVGVLDDATVRGAIILRGEIDGGLRGITVRHWPEYVQPFANYFVPNNPAVHVLSWN
jgi:hypothetical protein